MVLLYKNSNFFKNINVVFSILNRNDYSDLELFEKSEHVFLTTRDVYTSKLIEKC